MTKDQSDKMERELSKVSAQIAERRSRDALQMQNDILAGGGTPEYAAEKVSRFCIASQVQELYTVERLRWALTRVVETGIVPSQAETFPEQPPTEGPAWVAS